MSVLLVKCTLHACPSAEEHLRGILGSLCTVLKLKNRAIEEHRKEIISARQALDTISSEVGTIRADRDSFMSSFLAKFCLLLNSKKNEIRRLQEELSRLRNEVHCEQTQKTDIHSSLSSYDIGHIHGHDADSPSEPRGISQTQSTASATGSSLPDTKKYRATTSSSKGNSLFAEGGMALCRLVSDWCVWGRHAHVAATSRQGNGGAPLAGTG